MKYAEFNIESNKIEFLNSVFGIESVLLNGNRISRKFSFSGTRHKISSDPKEYFLTSKAGRGEIKLDLKESGELLETQVVKINKTQRNYWVFMGVALGMAAYRLLNLLVERLFS